MRNQPIGRLALGLHRAPLGDGNLRGDFAQGLRRLALRQSTFAKPQAADQGAMHDQIGVAADRRGKMRIAPQVEAEMAVILGGVFSLGLGAQNHFIHQELGIVSLDLQQHPIEQGRPQRAAFGKRQIEGLQEFLQGMNLLECRLIVHAVDKRQRLLFKHLGRGDVGQDHELFDQFMRVEPLRHDHAIDGAVGLEENLALGQIEIERVALVACQFHKPIGCVKRLQDRIEQGAGDFVRPAVDRGLCLRIVQLGGRAHQHAMEGV